MAFFATSICKLLVRHPWVNYIGAVMLVTVADGMLQSNWDDVIQFLGISMPRPPHCD